MTILVAGATSALGRALISELLRRGHEVRGLSRGHGTDGIAWHRGDVRDRASLEGCCDGVDVVISSVGAPVWPMWMWPETTFEETDHQGTRNLVDVASSAGVRKFVYVSVFGEYPNDLEYVAAHERAVSAIRDSEMTHTIVRPTGFHSALTFTVDLARWRLGVVVGGGRARSNPIADADLALACADAIDHPEAGTRPVAGRPPSGLRGGPVP